MTYSPKGYWISSPNDAEAYQRMIAVIENKDEDCTNYRNVRDALALASRHPALIVREEGLDADPYVICTPGGTLDLRTSELRPNRPEDYHTRCTLAAPTTLDDCPIWMEHLEWATMGNRDVQDYLQRWAGYLATGLTAFQKFLLVYGTGRNGKDVMFDTLRAVLGGYACIAPDGLFTSRDGDSSETARAAVCGYRMVYQSEPETGHRLNEQTLKQVTGGMKYSARHLFGKAFEYQAIVKPVLVVNRKPHVRGTDDGIWDRCCPVRFGNYIAPEDRDPYRIQKMIQNEAGGIMRWIAMGAAECLESGLGDPADVVRERAEYRSDMDTLGAILSDCCEPGEGFEMECGQFYTDAFETWWFCNMDRNDKWSRRVLARRMKERGISQRRSNGNDYWKGWRLK